MAGDIRKNQEGMSREINQSKRFSLRQPPPPPPDVSSPGRRFLVAPGPTHSGIPPACVITTELGGSTHVTPSICAATL